MLRPTTILLALLLTIPGFARADAAPAAQIAVTGQTALVLPNAPWTTTIAIDLPPTATQSVTVTILVSETMTIDIFTGTGTCVREDSGWTIWTVCRFTDPPAQSRIQMRITRAPIETIQATEACDRAWVVGTPIAIAIDAAPSQRADGWSPYQPGYCVRLPIIAGA